MPFLSSAKSVQSVKTIGYHRCGDGLYLQVSNKGTKSWLYRFKSPVTKKQREDFHLALEQEQRNLFPAQLYKYKVHKVRTGDSLARISKMYLGSQKHYAQLARLNELDSRRYLKIGQKLIVPIRKQD